MSRKVQYDRFGFEILEYDEPMNFTSTDDDDSDIMESDGVTWWRDDCSFDDEFSDEN